MKKESMFQSTKAICRAGVVAALYAVLSWVLGPFAWGPMQIRPAEALCMLPLFYVETVPALYIGCMLANLFSGYGLYDIFIGSLATLFAAICTYLVGKFVKNQWLKLALGGIFPVLFNAFIIPAVMILGGVEGITYWATFGSMVLTEGLWIYIIGITLYFGVKRLIDKNVTVMLPLTFNKVKKA